MPDFNEQIGVIKRLRKGCRDCDESLYTQKVKLHKAHLELARSDQKFAVSNPQRREEVDIKTRQIDENRRELGVLVDELREIGKTETKLAEATRAVAHLEQNLAGLDDRLEQLERKFAELEGTRPIPVAEIEAVEQEIERLQRIRDEAPAAIERAREIQEEIRHEAESLRPRRRELANAATDIREQIGVAQNDLAGLQQPTFRNRREIVATENGIRTEIADIESRCADCDVRLADAIRDLYGENPHPRRVVTNLDDGIPFLLLPVRLETIFVPATERRGSTPELWVRIFPDDIALHTHEEMLTDREVVAGELYWTELALAGHLRSERDAGRRSAWKGIVELLGGHRAAWVAAQTKPSDWAAIEADGAARDLIQFLVAIQPTFFDNLRSQDISDTALAELDGTILAKDPDALYTLAEKEKWLGAFNAAVKTQITGFPVHDVTKTDAWSRAPRSYVMPDRFVLLLYTDRDADPREIPGELIPDTLVLGPDPLDAEKSLPEPEADEAVSLGVEFDWMSDFDRAVEKGMGFKVALSDAEANNGFELVMALGVFTSADPATGGELVDELIRNHTHGPEGFAFIRQGTPTNNTEADSSGYSDGDPYDDLAFFSALDAAAFDPADPNPLKSQTDGRFCAEALGIPYSAFEYVRGADQTDVAEARWMNTALFPTTLGYFLNTWMSPVVDESTSRQTRSFFTRYVTGRGPLPAIRVGNQPYGLLLTSDFSRWQYGEGSPTLSAVRHRVDETVYLRDLYKLLSNLQKIWARYAADLLFVSRPGATASDVLMKILGLHPTSVEFFQRIGYGEEYLRGLDSFKDKGRYAKELDEMMGSLPISMILYLSGLEVPAAPKDIRDAQAMHVLWQHYASDLNAANLVENLPLSESAGLANNYIEWLANAASTKKIIDQEFDGEIPTSLLYLLLRNALLLQLHDGAHQWLSGRTDFAPELVRSTSNTTLKSIRGSATTISKVEMMSTRVGIAEPAHALSQASVADLIWLGPQPSEVEASFLKEQKAALGNLRQLSTARLERSLVEHLDCCNYRLDAWQTGLFAQRLDDQRDAATTADRKLGIYLGAYGWVENLKPTKKIFLDESALPPVLRTGDNEPILEEDDVIGPSRPVGARRAGFVHAPSLTHAAAAAVLRNAYLSHADPDRSEPFETNLSSARVRRAMFVLEGMRNGQPIEAMLGYMFERGLHDQTSKSMAAGVSPIVELNQFIVPYREAFVYKSEEIAQPGSSGPIEAVSAYNVVNGLTLAQAKLLPASGYGLGSVLASVEWPDAAQGKAILEEQARMSDTLDAVKDLLIAETSFQLVRGNYDRLGAVALSQKDAHVPHEFEVLTTPRGTEFSFTNRVTLHFEDLDPSLATSNPWPAVSLTPRAEAETGMNFWLGGILGSSPEKVVSEVSWMERSLEDKLTVRDTKIVTLKDLGLQPIDFVWLVNSNPDDTGGATELESRIAYHYRSTHGVPDDAIIQVTFAPKDPAAGKQTFATLFPMVRNVRSLLAECRPLNGQDFRPAAGAQDAAAPVDPNPMGYDATDLETRVKHALTDLTALADAIAGPSAPSVTLTFINDPNVTGDDETFMLPLGDAFAKLDEVKLSFTDDKKVNVDFGVGDRGPLGATLRSMSFFGISDSFAPEVDVLGDAATRSLLARAYRITRKLRTTDKTGILDKAEALLTAASLDKSVEKQVERLVEAGKLLLGEDFRILPKFKYHNEVDLAAAAGDRSQLLKHARTLVAGTTDEDVVDEWLQGLAPLRKQLHRWEVISTLAEAINGTELRLLPAQVPFRTPDSWLAVEFPATVPAADPALPPVPFGISRDTLSIVAHGDSAFTAGVRQSGILLDDWTEEIPTADETTGISFRFNQPGATAPQALLLAVTPHETGSWDWDDLVGTLVDTLERSKRRAVEPSDLAKEGPAWNALAPALVSEFSTLWQADVSLDLLLMLDFKPLEKFYAAKAIKT